jgi:hypothetical protein
MNNAIVSLLLIVVLCLLVISPFSALAMLMLVMFASALIGLVSVLIQSVVKHNPKVAPVDKE